MLRRLLLVVPAMIVLTGTAAGYALVHRPAPRGSAEVTLARGSGTSAIARELHARDVISSEIGFRLMAKLRGLDGHLQAGRYELRRGMGVHSALDALSAGPAQQTVSLTIPEGFTVRQVSARVGSRTRIRTDSFTQAIGSAIVRSAIQPAGQSNLEGFLFPETYAVNEEETAQGLLARMVRTFDERTGPMDWSGAASRGLSKYQALIVASLVEREAKVPEDRAKVAAVIYNRLAKNMLLQIDATVLYDLPEHKVPNKRDLQRPSAYNTYLHPGLPPTPIANPGIESIRAALEPAPIDALYYVVIDPSGRHGFAKTFAEFERLLKLRPAEVRGGTSGGSS